MITLHGTGTVIGAGTGYEYLTTKTSACQLGVVVRMRRIIVEKQFLKTIFRRSLMKRSKKDEREGADTEDRPFGPGRRLCAGRFSVSIGGSVGVADLGLRLRARPDLGLLAPMPPEFS